MAGYGNILFDMAVHGNILLDTAKYVAIMLDMVIIIFEETATHPLYHWCDSIW